jgi:hypothetical protein
VVFNTARLEPVVADDDDDVQLLGCLGLIIGMILGALGGFQLGGVGGAILGITVGLPTGGIIGFVVGTQTGGRVGEVISFSLVLGCAITTVLVIALVFIVLVGGLWGVGK